MSRLKVMTIVGTRPEIIRLSRVLTLLDQTTDHVLVHTGQNYDFELNEIFFSDLELKTPKHFLNAAAGSPSKTIGSIIQLVDDVIAEEMPDAVLILGDTNSSLAAISAKKRKIPVFHMEAGNRCFDSRVPEELNRKIVDHLADINLPYSDIAREYLLSEGISAHRVITTGSPMAEVLHYYRDKINKSKVLQTFGLVNKEYFVVSIHREENVDDIEVFKGIAGALNLVAHKYHLPIFMTTHPRTLKQIERIGVEFDSLITLSKPLSFSDYVCLQMNSKVVLSDSGTINEEASILGFSALNLRDSHERPEAMEQGSVIMAGTDSKKIMQCLELLVENKAFSNLNREIPKNYRDINVSMKVVSIIHSYANYKL